MPQPSASLRVLAFAAVLAVLAPAARAAEPAFAPQPEGPFDLCSEGFPIGIYSEDWDPEETFPLLASWGVTHVQSYARGQLQHDDAIERDQAFFDAAERHGLQVMANIRGHTLVQMAPAEARKRLKAYVEHYRDHPALGFWYFYDEPAPPKAPSELISGWKTFLKGLAPEVPTAICLKWDKTFREYRNSADILLADTYPVAGEPFPEAQIHLATRFHRECLKLGRPFMPVQQLINWKAYAPKDAEVFRGNAVEDLRFPDREELRYWFYSSAAIGCRGVFWYNFSRGAAGPDGRQWLAEVFAPVCREFRQFVDTVAPAWRRTQLHYATDEDLVISLWQRQAGTYLVCINEYPATKNINRRMEGLLDGGRLEPWGSTRDAGATLENGRLSVEAGPWEVFVWRVLPAETDGPITE